MIDRIEYLAHVSVARGCAFAAIAIMTFFVGMAADLTMALRSAGYLSLLTCVILLVKARSAARQPYKRTEVWTMLAPTERPEPEVAQHLISHALRQEYLYFAGHAALFALLFLATGLVWPLVFHH